MENVNNLILQYNKNFGHFPKKEIDNETLFNTLIAKTQREYFNKIYWDQSVVDDVCDKELKAAPDIFDGFIQPVVDYLDKQNDFSKAKSGLAKNYKKMNTDELEKVLVRILLVSEVLGRVSAQKEEVKNYAPPNPLLLEGGQPEHRASNIEHRFNKFFNKETKPASPADFFKVAYDMEPEDAINYLQSKGIKITWDWKEQLQAIKEHCFTVAKASKADVLQMFADELAAALKEGTTYQDFKKEVGNKLIDSGYRTREDGSAWRLDTIYRTNMQSSYMAGREREQLSAVKDFPYWRYVAVMDSRTRPSHAALNGIVLRYDDPFWTTHVPPNGYDCRCRKVTLSQEEVDALGIEIKKSTELAVDMDGKLVKVSTIKPDTGFETNPIDIWQPDLNKYDKDIKKELQADLK